MSPQQKIHLADMLPDHINFDAEGRLPMEYLKYDPDFRDGVRQAQTHLAAGMLDPAWIAEAEKAREERAAGEFDAFKEQEFEEYWGQKQTVDANKLAGKSPTVNFNRLVEMGYFKVGDVLSYSRSFKNKNKKTSVLVEKDCKVVASVPRLTML